MEEDIKAMVKQTTQEATLFINSTPRLYADIKEAIDVYDADDAAQRMSDVIEIWTDEHDGTFGALFEAELDAVDWDKVIRSL